MPLPPGIPGGLQNFVEWIMEFIDQSVRGSFPETTWWHRFPDHICLDFLMNLMDLVPVDVIPAIVSIAWNTFYEGSADHRSQRHLWHGHWRVYFGAFTASRLKDRWDSSANSRCSHSLPPIRWLTHCSSRLTLFWNSSA